MAKDKETLPSPASQNEVDEFLRKVVATPAPRPAEGRGRLIFAMDATASREPTWNHACQIQGEMFEATAALGGLEIQLVYYRGFGECRHSRWLSDSRALVRSMTGVRCLGGHTQIRKVLEHAIAETKRKKVAALVFVGDCMEEDADQLCHLAGELSLLNVPVFIFHEGNEPVAARTFRQIARLTQGAYCGFDARSADQLRALLSAVAVYAAGGRRALEDYGKRAGGNVLRIARQVK
ncbi:MAG: VWA domain-containing protein [Alphaproteobacteria bacterium]